jgi:hypothetical protein
MVLIYKGADGVVYILVMEVLIFLRSRTGHICTADDGVRDIEFLKLYRAF